MAGQPVADDVLQQAVTAYQEAGTKQAAADKLGLSVNTLKYRINLAARQGIAPGHFSNGVAPGYAMGKVTVQRNASGDVERTWERQSPADEFAQEAFRIAMQDIVADAKGIFPPSVAPTECLDNLLTVIPMGDPHFGLMSWAKETGENFDLQIAEDLTFGAVDRLCSMGPRSKTAILLNLGDYFHADNNSNKTPQSGNPLDVDGRFQKIAAVGFRAMVRCVRRMLENHETVIVRNNPGNHDPHQACMLSMALGAMFHDNPRVYVDESPAHYWYYLFGKVLIGSAHGDGAKLPDLPLIMATDQPDSWAASVFRAWHCGHVHHDQVKEYPGCHVETHGTLAATDAWHRYKGYRSMRSMKSIIYDKTYGEVQRLNCNVERLAA